MVSPASEIMNLAPMFWWMTSKPEGLPHLLAGATLQAAVCAAVAAPAELLPPVQAGTAGGLLLAVVFCKRLVVNRSEDVKITFDVVEDEGGVHLVPHALVHVVEDGLDRPVLLQLLFSMPAHTQSCTHLHRRHRWSEVWSLDDPSWGVTRL